MGCVAGLSLSSARSRHLYPVVPRHHCVRSSGTACLSKVLLIGERSLRLALSEYVAHYHAERNHQGRTTSCCFLVTRKPDEAGLCNVAKGWAGFCIIIIKKPRNLAEKSRMILWLEVDCTCARTTAGKQVSPNIACAVDRQSHEGLGNNQRASISRNLLPFPGSPLL